MSEDSSLNLEENKIFINNAVFEDYFVKNEQLYLNKGFNIKSLKQSNIDIIDNSIDFDLYEILPSFKIKGVIDDNSNNYNFYLNKNIFYNLSKATITNNLFLSINCQNSSNLINHLLDNDIFIYNEIASATYSFNTNFKNQFHILVSLLTIIY